MQALRQIEATIDSVVTVLSNSIPGFVTASSAAGAQVSAHPPSFSAVSESHVYVFRLNLHHACNSAYGQSSLRQADRGPACCSLM